MRKSGLASVVIAALVVCGSVTGATSATTEAVSSEIAFSGRPAFPIGSYPFAIWTVRGDGRDLTKLTRPPKDAQDFAPAWSPDRRRIAFLRQLALGEIPRRGYVSRLDLMVMNIDGSAPRQLPSANGHGLAWSPDGTRIAFGKDYAGDKWIWTIKPDGSDADPLAPGQHPSWSPSGRQIAFTGHESGSYAGKDAETFVMNADGSALRKLVPGFGGDNHRPAWSPTGRQIAFIGCRCGFGTGEPFTRGWITRNSLYIVKPNGKALRKLVGRASVHGGNFPEWSSDGSRLLIERQVPWGSFGLFVASVSGGLRRMATPPVAQSPALSPEGQASLT